MSEETMDGRPKLNAIPAVIAVLLQWVIIYCFVRWGSTLVQNVVGMAGVPIFTAIFLLVWWFRSKAVPRRERWLGLLLVAVAFALVALVQPKQGYFMLAYAWPVTLTAVVLQLFVTSSLMWPRQRAAAIAVILVCTGIFSALRVETVGGNLYPVVGWRWKQNTQERMAAQAEASESHGVAKLPAQVSASDWPGFRGAKRDARVEGVTFSSEWAITPPKEIWRHEIGPAWSSFAAVGDYLFTQEQRGTDEFVTCYEAGTGKEVWSSRNPAQFEDPMGLGPRATPAYDNGKLYAIGALGLLQCLDTSNGKEIWRHDISGDGGKSFPMYAYAASPLVVDGLVVAFACGDGRGDLAAFDAATGQEVWSAAKGTRGYASPQLSILAGTPQILMPNENGVQAYTPATGTVLWSHDWPFGTYPRCVQPMVTENDELMVGTSGETGSRLVAVKHTDDQWQATEVWTNSKHRPYFNDGVYHKGHVYGFDGNRLNCIDMKTGEGKWQGSRFGGQVILVADMDMLLVLSEKGEAVLVSAKPEAFEVVGQLKALTGKTWNSPVIANGKLYVRNSDEVACFEFPEVQLAKV